MALLALVLVVSCQSGSARSSEVSSGGHQSESRIDASYEADSLDRLLAGLPERVTAAMADHRLTSVSMAIVLGDDTIFSRAFGLADIGQGRPATSGTIYPAGSITKLFTATMLVRLWEQGIVNLEDPVHEYLPEYQPRSQFPGTQPTTLRQLAAHTSGLPRDAPANFWCDYARFIWHVTGGETPLAPYVHADSLLAGLRDLEILHPPDVHANYSNLGFQVLGLALERACDRPFAVYVEEEILAPLGMDDSTFNLGPQEHLRLATGYVCTGPEAEPKTAPMHDLGCAVFSGGLFTTAEDLARFVSAQWPDGREADNRVLTTGALRRMRTPQSIHRPGVHECYGLGWGVCRIGGHEAIEQNGALVGYSSHISAVPALRLGIVALSNSRNAPWHPDACKELARAILADLADALVEAEEAAGEPEAAAVPHALFEGFYALPGGVAHLEVEAVRTGLRVTLVEEPDFSESFTPIAPNAFCFASDPNEEPALYFDATENGDIAGVEFLGHRFQRVQLDR